MNICHDVVITPDRINSLKGRELEDSNKKLLSIRFPIPPLRTKPFVLPFPIHLTLVLGKGKR